jgi:rhomboid protease GluP
MVSTASWRSTSRPQTGSISSTALDIAAIIVTRSYYCRSVNSGRSVSRVPLTMTTSLVCVAVFAVQVSQDPNTLAGLPTGLEDRLGFVATQLTLEPWRALIGPFVHVAPWHLLNNVGFLLLLGSWLEVELGRLRWAVLFFGGIAAGEAAGAIYDPNAALIGISGGLMALVAAGVLMERHNPFASQRRRFCLLTLGLTLVFNLAAPDLGSLPAHVAGALAGGFLSLVMPAPLAIRQRLASARAAAIAAWTAELTTIEPAPADEMSLEVRPSAGRVVSASLAGLFFVVTGVSLGLQSFWVDQASAIGAIGIGVFTAVVGGLVCVHEVRRYFRAGPEGITGRRWKRVTGWGEISSFYPGRVYFGLLAHESVGCTLRDGGTLGMDTLGHGAGPLARRLEALRRRHVEVPVESTYLTRAGG